MSFVENHQDFKAVVFKKHTKSISKQNTNTNVDSSHLTIKKFENDSENLTHQRVSCSRQIIDGRISKGWNRSKLAQAMNVKEKVVDAGFTCILGAVKIEEDRKARQKLRCSLFLTFGSTLRSNHPPTRQRKQKSYIKTRHEHMFV